MQVQINFLISFFFQQKWVAILSSEYPTLAFHASLTNPFGKGALLQLLKQFGKVSTNHWQSLNYQSSNHSYNTFSPLYLIKKYEIDTHQNG